MEYPPMNGGSNGKITSINGGLSIATLGIGNTWQRKFCFGVNVGSWLPEVWTHPQRYKQGMPTASVAAAWLNSCDRHNDRKWPWQENVGRFWPVGTFIQGSGFCSSSPELEVWHDHHLAVAAKAAVKTTASATLQLSQLHLSISDVRHLPGDVDALLLEHWHVLWGQHLPMWAVPGLHQLLHLLRGFYHHGSDASAGAARGSWWGSPCWNLQRAWAVCSKHSTAGSRPNGPNGPGGPGGPDTKAWTRRCRKADAMWRHLATLHDPDVIGALGATFLASTGWRLHPLQTGSHVPGTFWQFALSKPFLRLFRGGWLRGIRNVHLEWNRNLSTSD